MNLALLPRVLEIMTLVYNTYMLFFISLFRLRNLSYFNNFKDFGVENLMDLISQTNFPWLMSNVFDADSNKPLAMANTKHVINFNGLKV
jgi:hypothetical protein